MKLSITRKKKTESISVENNRVNEIRKETQLDVNLELSDIPKSLVDFIKSKRPNLGPGLIWSR